MYYKLGQTCGIVAAALLQIKANVIINWGSVIITNCVKCCCKLGQLLPIRAAVITK